ncbi:desmethyl-deoxy-podophyllotoxin synthase-like [Magnolia sinica]|uniref:desmethyl-deoxy-podophyllotoxin synthase-like n=1 Tax=Magnolia sinica TaxID=86752 RepID=UPI00265854A9|nr:desmethyl-deoxy-podophyllotoxin synthase-like [Magnolia sinica]
MEFQSFSTLLFFTFLLFLFIMIMKKGRWPTTQNPIPKLPPGPPKLPIIGNIHQLLGPLPHHILTDLARKYGPLMHLKLGHLSTIVISSSRMAKEIMRTHDLNFAMRPKLLALEITAYGSTNVTFSPYGDYWRQLRKICTLELLSASRVESFRSIREEEVSNLIWTVYNSAGSPVNLSDMFLTIINNMISRATVGKTCKEREVFIDAVKEGVKAVAGMDISDFYPSLGFLSLITGLRFRLERIHRKFDRILSDIIKEHKQKHATVGMNCNESNDEDFVDVLLRLQLHGNLEFPLTTNNVKAIILDMMGAGTDTSSTFLEWAMAEMVKNPRVMEKAQAEVRQVFKGKGKVDERDTNKLNYLKLVIKETLRLHPPAPLVPRECREKCEIDGYEIPVTTRVILNIWAIGRDPEHWDDPDSFKPERFDGTSIDYKGTHFEYVPFGAGRRICPGMTIGMANVVLPLANLLYYFDWKLPSGMKGEDLDMTEAFSATIPRKYNLCLVPIPCIPLPTELKEI